MNQYPMQAVLVGQFANAAHASSSATTGYIDIRNWINGSFHCFFTGATNAAPSLFAIHQATSAIGAGYKVLSPSHAASPAAAMTSLYSHYTAVGTIGTSTTAANTAVWTLDLDRSEMDEANSFYFAGVIVTATTTATALTVVWIGVPVRNVYANTSWYTGRAGTPTL